MTKLKKRIVYKIGVPFKFQAKKAVFAASVDH